MKNDEFNYIEVTNDQEIYGKEYGATTSSEYFSQPENKTVKDELNENKEQNTENQKEEERRESKRSEQNNETTSSSSSSSSGASKGIAGGAANASTSAATAAPAIAVAASTVAVAAVAISIGMPVIANNNAIVELASLVANYSSVHYSLVLKNTELDNFSAYVESRSGDYLSRQQIKPGDNEGDFEGLSPDVEYRFVVKEDGDLGRVLTYEIFTTEGVNPGPEPTYDAVINTYEFSRTLDEDFNTVITLEYEDEANMLSDFELYLRDEYSYERYQEYKEQEEQGLTPSQPSKDIIYDRTFPIEKKNGEQILSLMDEEFYVDIYTPYYYELRYTKNGNKIIHSSDEFNFESPSGDGKVNGISSDFGLTPSNLFKLTLDYENIDFDLYLELSMDNPQGEERLTGHVPLELTTEEQVVNLNLIDNPMMSDWISTDYTYNISIDKLAGDQAGDQDEPIYESLYDYPEDVKFVSDEWNEVISFEFDTIYIIPERDPITFETHYTINPFTLEYYGDSETFNDNQRLELRHSEYEKDEETGEWIMKWITDYTYDLDGIDPDYSDGIYTKRAEIAVKDFVNSEGYSGSEVEQQIMQDDYLGSFNLFFVQGEEQAEQYEKKLLSAYNLVVESVDPVVNSFESNQIINDYYYTMLKLDYTDISGRCDNNLYLEVTYNDTEKAYAKLANTISWQIVKFDDLDADKLRGIYDNTNSVKVVYNYFSQYQTIYTCPAGTTFRNSSFSGLISSSFNSMNLKIGATSNFYSTDTISLTYYNDSQTMERTFKVEFRKYVNGSQTLEYYYDLANDRTEESTIGIDGQKTLDFEIPFDKMRDSSGSYVSDQDQLVGDLTATSYQYLIYLTCTIDNDNYEVYLTHSPFTFE